MKGLGLNELSIRTQRLHGLFDTQAGVVLGRAQNEQTEDSEIIVNGLN